jgi:hypothetical protein
MIKWLVKWYITGKTVILNNTWLHQDGALELNYINYEKRNNNKQDSLIQ